MAQTMKRIEDDVYRFVDDVAKTADNIRATLLDEPVSEVKDLPSSIMISMPFPGIDRSAIAVAVSADELEIAVRPPKQRFFERTIRLPSAIDPARATATYRNGMLTITMPKQNRAKRGVPIGS